jgi:hypothetical protein
MSYLVIPLGDSSPRCGHSGPVAVIPSLAAVVPATLAAVVPSAGLATVVPSVLSDRGIISPYNMNVYNNFRQHYANMIYYTYYTTFYNHYNYNHL